MDTAKEDYLLTTLREAYKGKDWFYDVGYDQFGRPVLYTKFECHETIWDLPDKWEGKQLLVHFASSAPGWKSDYLNKPEEKKYTPYGGHGETVILSNEEAKRIGFSPSQFMAAAREAQAKGIDTGFVGAMDAEGIGILEQMAEKDELERERELELSVRALTDEIDRLEKLCGSNILQDIFYEIQDGKNAVTNLSARYPEVRQRMEKLHAKYGFDIIYEELDG